MSPPFLVQRTLVNKEFRDSFTGNVMNFIHRHRLVSQRHRSDCRLVLPHGAGVVHHLPRAQLPGSVAMDAVWPVVEHWELPHHVTEGCYGQPNSIISISNISSWSSIIPSGGVWRSWELFLDDTDDFWRIWQQHQQEWWCSAAAAEWHFGYSEICKWGILDVSLWLVLIRSLWD